MSGHTLMGLYICSPITSYSVWNKIQCTHNPIRSHSIVYFKNYIAMRMLEINRCQLSVKRP